MFKAQYIKAIKSTDKKQEIMDAGNPGFGIRVQPSGTKTWIYRYRYSGKIKRLSLGSYPAISLAGARKRYLTAQAKHREGKDPQGGADTVRELADLYIERHAKPNKRTWKVDRQMLDRDVLPRIGSMKLEAVRKRDILMVIDAVTDRGALTMSNRVLSLLKKMFSFAVDRDLIEYSPASGVKRQHTERTVDRVLSDGELQQLMTGKHTPTLDVMRLMALTGQRRGEICKMRYDDMERDLWTIPGEFTKNKKEHHVPLVPEVWPIIDRQESPNEFVFNLNPSSVSIAAQRIGQGWTPHDIRRTVATRLAEVKVPQVVISKLLNHTDQSVTAVYDRHRYIDEMREALEAWTQHLVSL